MYVNTVKNLRIPCYLLLVRFFVSLSLYISYSCIYSRWISKLMQNTSDIVKT
jgi:hypothetical protein